MSDVPMASVSAALAEPHRGAALLATARARLWSVIGGSFRRPNLTVAIAIAALVLFTIVTTPLWTGRVATCDDMGSLNLPVRAFYARCLADGESFAWMPQILGGAYLAGEGNNVSYHPLELLIYRLFSLPVAVQIDVFLPCVMVFFGMAWFLRRYVKDAGAWSGAFFVTFSVKWLAHLEHHPMLVTLAHLPWLLGAMQVAVTTPNTRRRRLAGVAIAFLTGSQFLYGHPQTLWFCVLSECAFAVCLLFHRPLIWKGWATLVLGMLLGVCMGAIKIFGLLSFFAESSRAAADPGFANQFALNPHTLVGMLAPYLLFEGVSGWGGIYFGAVPLTLAVWWLCAGMWTPARPSNPGEAENDHAIRRLSLFAAILAILTLWLAPGFAWKLYYLQACLPVVGKLRCPDRFWMLTAFYVAVLGALAFSRLSRCGEGGHKLSWKSMLVPWLLLATVTIIAGCFYFGGYAAAKPPALGHLFFGPLLFGLTAVAFTMAGRGYRIGLLLLVIVGAIDLGLYGVGNPAAMKVWHRTQNYEKFLAGINGPPDANAGRVYDTSIYADVLWLHGYRLAGGYMGGMSPQRQLDYRHVNTLRAAEVAWFFDFWTPGNVAGLVPPTGWSCWWRVPNPLPRARLVSRALPSVSPGKDLKTIDVDHVVLVTHPIELPDSRAGEAKIVEDKPGRIGVQIAAPTRQILTVSETYHSGWRVQVDGKRVPLERINGDFIGCVVDSGRHQVQFVFAPPLVHYGRMISLVGLGLGICWMIGPGRFAALGRRRRSAPPPP